MKFTKRQLPKQDMNSGSYLKLKDGESVKVVFLGEIFEFFQIWPFGGEKQIFDKPTSGASPRFKVNLALYDKDRFVVKVWEFGLPTYIQLSDIHDIYPLETTKIQITRRGSGKSTTYAIIPLIKEPLPAKLLAELKGLQLHILGSNPKLEDNPEENFGSEPWPDAEEIPF